MFISILMGGRVGGGGGRGEAVNHRRVLHCKFEEIW